jgi:hypothetical protein
MIESSYYAGGHRIMLGGVPCRIARRPVSPNHAAMLRKTGHDLAHFGPVDPRHERKAYTDAVKLGDL